MKKHNLLKLTAFCATIALSPVDALAQAGRDATTPTATTSSAATSMDHEDKPDYGWIGLLGLLGLAGLLRKPHTDHAHVTTTSRNV